MTPQHIPADDLDLRAYLRTGETVVWGQASAEPVTLVRAVVAQRADLGPLHCFLGIQFAGTVGPEHADHLRLTSYCGTGANRALAKAGVLEIYPGHYSTLPWLLSRGPMRADAVLVQCAPLGDGRYSLGLADDYLSAAIDSARVVIAEVNDQVPATPGSRYLTGADIDVIVETSLPPVQAPAQAEDEVTARIAARVAGLIEDGATLQFGIGALPELVLRQLKDRRRLGIHSGLVSDAAADLIVCGAVTGTDKHTDRGIAVGAMLIGTERLFRIARDSRAIELRPASYTHDSEVLAVQNRFTAINSAIEVDLTGQVNAEIASGIYVGAVGGAAEFLRAAAHSTGGLPIVALPATAGIRSRIVTELSGPVSTARADAGIFVTEYGIADLRGLPLSQRRRRMIELAHPDHRAHLAEGVL
ncbi:acetyl-CoA hydrolase/transferase family protein [Nocardia seriolae]|uniref:acetyl-CoA hydrolase/transferase family protein n=1 Tax=Nocardia seriolae TaxID=37332 RepID=UPI00051A09FB|nr:acetyl-CoA hydrolase/transferase C-terminal domain-containing protein [Nocardia seriolae]BEK87598.1 acetyl-CoA hydrolase/transferase C-terminal domain-containing protein [Nocardia seriolae]